MQGSADCRALRYRDDMKESWDACVTDSKNGSFLFLRDYMDHHRDRFDDNSFIFIRDGQVIACLPAHRTGDCLSSHQGLTFGGLVMHRSIRLSAVLGIFEALCEEMRTAALQALYYRHMPHPYHLRPSEEDLFVLVNMGARIIESKATSIVSAGDRSLYSRNRRRDIKRVGRSHLSIRQSFDFCGFMDLCADYLWLRRGAVPLHSGEELARLASRFPNNIALYTAEDHSGIIGGIVIYRNAVCTRSQYLAQSAYGQRLGVLSAIYDHILMQVLNAGAAFDFGPSADPATGQLDDSLHRYKESFGARTIQVNSYQLSVERRD